MLLISIYFDAGAGGSDCDRMEPIVVKATAEGLLPAQITIPVTCDSGQLPLSVASASASATT